MPDANLIVGVLALCFGLLTLVMRFTAPDSVLLGKLRDMKERFGDTAGAVLHVFCYTALPLVFGAVVVVTAALGMR